MTLIGFCTAHTLLLKNLGINTDKKKAPITRCLRFVCTRRTFALAGVILQKNTGVTLASKFFPRCVPGNGKNHSMWGEHLFLFTAA